MPKKCETCRYYDGRNCRRFAPRVVVVGDLERTAWPEVVRDDWCGEWQPDKDPMTGASVRG